MYHFHSASAFVVMLLVSGSVSRPFEYVGPPIKITPAIVAARASLERAPNLKPKPENPLDEKQFIALAQTITGNQKLNSLVDSIEALELTTQDVGRPRATIKSTPNGWVVRYRGYVDYKKNRGEWVTVKTNSTSEVDPKQYIFRCTKDDGTSCGERIRPCDISDNCIAEFP